MDKKIRAISVAFLGSFFARISIPNYLNFSRFYLKNRTTTKPTSKSLFFNDFNARRRIATSDYNSMVNDGNCPVRIHKRERTIGQLLHARQRRFLRRNALTLYQAYHSITYEHLFVKCFYLLFYRNHNRIDAICKVHPKICWFMRITT